MPRIVAAPFAYVVAESAPLRLPVGHMAPEDADRTHIPLTHGIMAVEQARELLPHATGHEAVFIRDAIRDPRGARSEQVIRTLTRSVDVVVGRWAK